MSRCHDAPPWEVPEFQRANGQRSPPAPGTLCPKSLGSLKPFPAEMKNNNDIYVLIYDIIHSDSSNDILFPFGLDRYITLCCFSGVCDLATSPPLAARKEQDYSTIQESIGSTRCHES